MPPAPSNRPETYGQVVRRQALARPDAVVTRFEDRSTTYAQLDRATDRVASAFAQAGVQPGQRIAYLGKNSDRALELTLGAAKAGVVTTPIGWRLAPAEIAAILDDCEAAMLFAEDEFAGAVAAMAPLLAHRTPIVAIRGAVAGWTDYAAWRDAAPATPPVIEVSPDDIVLQIYTSGTTGQPKGVMLSHANSTALRAIVNAEAPAWLAGAAGETLLFTMPYAHVAGVGQALLGVFNGVTLLIHREFDPATTLAAIAAHRPQRLFLVPAAIRMLISHPDAAATDFSSVRYLSYGASPIPLELLRDAMRLLGCGFIQLYGMTETWGTIAALAPEDHDLDRPQLLAAAGQALPGVSLRILGPDGAVLPPGETGEVAIRSPSVMGGYWKRSEETAQVIDAEAWYRTGDAGRLDAQGYLFIQDRLKDMIISGAENIYPAEVESAIFGHPDVADVAVIGVPDPRWGEAVKAMVVLKPGAAPDPDAIIAWARTRIAAFKAPKSVAFIDAVPRNPSGKILRRELREPFWAGRTRRVN